MNRKSGTFLQFIHDVPLKPTLRRMISFQDFENFRVKFSDKPVEDQFKISRAIRWQRASFEGAHILDQYMGTWFGLETLDYFRSGDIEYQKCPKDSECESNLFTCENGHIHQRERMNRGVRKMLGKDYNKMAALRNKIAHGGGKLQNVIEDCSRYLPISAGNLVNGIVNILGMPNDFQIPSLFLKGNYQVVRLHGNLEVISKESDLSLEPLFAPFFSFDQKEVSLDLSTEPISLSTNPKGESDSRFQLTPQGFSIVGTDPILQLGNHHLDLLKSNSSI